MTAPTGGVLACTLGGATGALLDALRWPAFQMCLARAVTGPARFKGGTCSFGAPAANGAEDSPARIQAAGMQLARPSLHASRGRGRGTLPRGCTGCAGAVTRGCDKPVSGNGRKRQTPALPFLYTRRGSVLVPGPRGGRSR